MRKTVSSLLPKAFFCLLKNAGVKNAEQLIENCGVSLYELETITCRIPEKTHFNLITEYSKYSDIIKEYLYSSCDDDNNILNSAHQLFPELIGYSLNQCSLENAINAFVESRFIAGDCDSISIFRTDNRIKLSYINEGPHAIGDVSAISNFMVLYNITNHYAIINDIEIGFTGLHPDDRNHINDFFRTKCNFNSSENYIIFNLNKLHKNNIINNQLLCNLQRNTILKKRASIYKQGAFSNTISVLIEKIIAAPETINSDNSILAEVCTIMKMSRWTLNSRLKQEQTTFSSLLTSIKLRIACDLLIRSNKSIQEISELVCFSSASAFSRFFIMNLNMSPLSYRKRIRVE